MKRRDFVKTTAVMVAGAPFISIGEPIARRTVALPRNADELFHAISRLFPKRWDVVSDSGATVHQAEFSISAYETTLSGKRLTHETLALTGGRNRSGMEADLCEKLYLALLQKSRSGHDHLIWRVRPTFTEWEDHTIPDYAREDGARKAIPAGTRLRARLTTGTA